MKTGSKRARATFEQCVKLAAFVGLKLETYNPGDGNRVRIFCAYDPSDFFGPSNPIDTIYGKNDRETMDLLHAWFSGWLARNARS